MSITDAARQACRSWYSSAPMGPAMSVLADQLAAIDKGITNGRQHQGFKGSSADNRESAPDEAALAARGHCQNGEAQDAD